MAAKGSSLKQEIANKILATFPGSFLYNDGKEIRINGIEDGIPYQIKAVLTCAKTPVECGGENINFSEVSAAAVDVKPTETSEKIPAAPTAEEKERLATLLERLGL